MNKKKNIIYVIMGFVFLFSAILTTTFAFWSVTKNQEKENFVNTNCFDITFKDENQINISNAYPIAEDDGKKLQPYIFTITNKCGDGSHYVINLETVTTKEKKLKEEYLRGYLTNGQDILFNDTLKDEYINNEKVIKASSKAIKLYEGDSYNKN